jgi:thiamine biosynthesis lipoprotein
LARWHGSTRRGVYARGDCALGARRRSSVTVIRSRLPDALRAALLLAAAAWLAGCSRARELQTLTGLAQGTTYTVQWWSERDVDTPALSRAVADELARIDELLSNYRPDSALERFNAARTTEPQEVPAELVTLLRLAADVHRASAGCFDPTVRPLVRLWGFDGDSPRVPADDQLEAVRASVGFDKIAIVDADHVSKLASDVAIDMASIGQGYTVGRLAAVAERFDLTDYLVEIGGELLGRGRRPDGRSWRVGVESPSAEGAALRALPLPTRGATAVITSGTYRHFFEHGGKVYGHIIDPRTGRPVDHALVSVTVVGRDPAHAAAWGTALLCLGPAAGAAAADALDLAAVLTVRTNAGFEQRPTARFAAEWPNDAE